MAAHGSAVQRVLSALSAHQRLIVQEGASWKASCPGSQHRRGDQSPSLSIAQGKKGAMLTCRSVGCDVAEIVQAVGLTEAMLFDDYEEQRSRTPAATRSSGRKARAIPENLVATYDYVDEHGALLYQVRRYEEAGAEKTFNQRRPDPANAHIPDSWIQDVKDVRRVLWRLDKIQGQALVCLTEGEKCAEALEGIGLVATTNSGGSAGWQDNLVEQLVAAGGQEAVVFEDRDTPGMKWAARVANACLRAGITPKIIDAVALGLTQLGADVADWITAGGTKKRLLEIIKEAQPYTGPVETPLVRWRKAADLDSTPISYLVEGMIPNGWLGAIGGKDGRGKTLFGLEVAKCVLTGEKLFGQFAVQQGKVFAMLLDDPENMVHARLKQMGLLDHPNLKVATLDDVDMDDRQKMLDYLAAQLSTMEPTFILIDALYLFVPDGSGATDKANSGSAMRPLMVAFDAIANRTHATVALVAHDNKAGGDIAGSHVIRNMLKWIIRLILPKEYEDDPEGGVETQDRILQLNKLKTGRNTSWHLTLNGPGEWAFHGDNRAHRKSTIKDRILASLFDHGHSTISELKADLRCREKDARDACGALLVSGQITRGERPRTDGKPGRGALTYGPLDPLRGTGMDRSGPDGGTRMNRSGPPLRPVSPLEKTAGMDRLGTGSDSFSVGTRMDRSDTQAREKEELLEKANLSIPTKGIESLTGPKAIHPGAPGKAINPGARGEAINPDDPTNDLELQPQPDAPAREPTQSDADRWQAAWNRA